MTSTDTLLPCPVPWCGSDVLEAVRSPWSHGYCITCQSCRVQSPSRETEPEAIAAWNRRADSAERDRLAGEVARLREALEVIASSHWERFGMDQTDIEQLPDLSADEAMNAARDALSYDDDQPARAALAPKPQ